MNDQFSINVDSLQKETEFQAVLLEKNRAILALIQEVKQSREKIAQYEAEILDLKTENERLDVKKKDKK